MAAVSRGRASSSKPKDKTNPDRGRTTSQPADKKKLGGKSPSGKTDREPCRYYLKGKCEKGDKCDYWHPPVCRDLKKGKCEAGKKCCFLHPRERNATPAATPEDEKETKPPKKEKEKPKAKVKSKAIIAQALLTTVVATSSVVTGESMAYSSHSEMRISDSELQGSGIPRTTASAQSPFLALVTNAGQGARVETHCLDSG